MFISERRWVKVVAHVVRRLWEIDGNSRGDKLTPGAQAVFSPETYVLQMLHAHATP